MSNKIKVGMMVSVSGGPAQKVTHVSPPSGSRRDWRYRVSDRCHSGKYLKVVPSSTILHNDQGLAHADNNQNNDTNQNDT